MNLSQQCDLDAVNVTDADAADEPTLGDRFHTQGEIDHIRAWSSDTTSKAASAPSALVCYVYLLKKQTISWKFVEFFE